MPFVEWNHKNYFDDLRQSDAEFREAWESSRSEYAVLSQLEKARKQKGLSQSDLAKLSGNKQQVISRIEKHESSPTLKTLSAITNALDMDIVLVPRNA